MVEQKENIHDLLPSTGENEKERREQKEETLSLIKNLYSLLEDELEERDKKYSVKISTGGLRQEYSEVYNSLEQLENIEPDYDRILAELESEKGLRTEIEYIRSQKFPDDFEEAEEYGKMGNGVLIKHRKVRFPPKLTVEIKTPENYDTEEIERLEKCVEAFVDFYRQLV